MSDTAFPFASTGVRHGPGWWLSELHARQPVLAGTAFLVGLSILPMAFAGLVDQRLFNGIDAWIKPLKFALAIAIYLYTLAFFASWIDERTARRGWFRGLVWVVAAASLFEMSYIAFAAAHDEASHFNYTDTLHMTLYGIMGVGATTMIGLSAVMGLLIARNRALDGMPAVRDGVVIGLVLSFVLTMVAAGTLSTWGSHWIGGIHSDAGGMAVTGWSRDGGDLRVAHLFGTHAMHFIPVFAVISALVCGARNRLPVWLFSGAYVGFFLFLYVQALMGEPFLAFIR